MNRSRWCAVALFAIAALAAGARATATLDAQGGTTYRARLFPLPVDASNQATTTGNGSVSATLRGATLTLTGSFADLQKPATLAKVHVGPRGIRGPAVLDLTVTKGVSGTLQGTLMLSPAQVDHLRRGRLYVQIHSEAAPDGNLWGWLLP